MIPVLNTETNDYWVRLEDYRALEKERDALLRQKEETVALLQKYDRLWIERDRALAQARHDREAWGKAESRVKVLQEKLAVFQNESLKPPN